VRWTDKGDGDALVGDGPVGHSRSLRSRRVRDPDEQLGELVVGLVNFEVKHCPCGAEIIWASTKANKAMPVNAEVAEGGNVLLSERPHREPLAEVLEVTALDAHPGRLRLSHFATCRFAEQFRKTATVRRRKPAREGSS